MNGGRWCTKEDVLKDLELASGQKVTDVDDGFFVVGEQPPPPRMFADDDSEIELQFGRSARTQKLDQDVEARPDLMGITKMLRMVQQYENYSDEETTTPAKYSKKKIVISKLNPNVKEFIPKSARDVSSQDFNVTKKNDIANGADTKTNDITEVMENKNINTKEFIPKSGRVISSQDFNVTKSKVIPNVACAETNDITEVMENKNINTKEFIPKSGRVISSQDFNVTKSKVIPNVACAETNDITEVMENKNINTKEFIPKSGRVISSQDFNVTKSKVIPNVACAETNDITEVMKNKNIINTKTVAIDVKNEQSPKQMKKHMAAILKNKISSKSDTFEEQMQTNSAIVNLLKLYAKSEPQKIEAAKPIKLYTPQFFENCKASDFKSNEDDTSKDEGYLEQTTSLPSEDKSENINVSSQQPHSISDTRSVVENVDAFANCYSRLKDDTKNIKLTMPNKEKNVSDDLPEATKLTPDMADSSIADEYAVPSAVVETVDPYVVESISKVNNWFDHKPSVIEIVEKDKPKTPVLYLGAVAYKRKDPVTCNSPSEVTDKKVPKPSIGEYIPSSEAEVLLQKYKARSKKTEPTLNIWEKLEKDLKQKDAEIKNRRKNNAMYKNDD